MDESLTNTTLASDHVASKSHEHLDSFQVISTQFASVKVPFFVTLFLLVASGMKTVFHLSNKITKIVPESCLLVILGVVASLILYYSTGGTDDYNLDSSTFFYLLLPPIVFDAGYFMPNRAFFKNLGTILLYAVVGTIWNTFLIGIFMWFINELGWYKVDCGLLPILTFSALISAVDPVAVLAVFEEIHVNEVLHILVFGESLLNDAVTVVIYHMMEAFTEIGPDNIKATDIISGIASFFFVSCGGTLIGVFFGLITAFVTKYTDHVRVIEPIFVFAFSYLSYICAEIFHFSGILAIVFCGITMAQYVEENISHKSHTTIKYFLKMMSSVSEAIIFLFLGLSTSESLANIDVVFVVMAVLACLLFRFAGVYFLTSIANKFRVEKLNWSQQFIMAYGGIRGGVAFCLAVLLKEDVIGEQVKGIFVSTTIIVVFFTVFIQGITIKPLVQAFRIKMQNPAKLNIFETMAERVVDHVMSGIEDVVGTHGENWLRVHYEVLNNRYLRPGLLRVKPVTSELNMMRAFSRLNIQETVNYVQSHQNMFLAHSASQNSLSNFMRKEFEKYDGGGCGGLGDAETCLDMRPVTRQVLIPVKMLEDAAVHKESMQSAFHRRSKAIVSGAQIKFTNPRHAIPDKPPSRRRHRKSDHLHHMQMYNPMVGHHLINSKHHKRGVGGSYTIESTPNQHIQNEEAPRGPSVSFILPTPNAKDLDKYLNPLVADKHATNNGDSHAIKNGALSDKKRLPNTKSVSDVKVLYNPNHSQKSSLVPALDFNRQNSSDHGWEEYDGITFSAGNRKPSDVKINVSGDEGAVHFNSGGVEPEEVTDDTSSVLSMSAVQTPVAIESYLPWKDSEIEIKAEEPLSKQPSDLCVAEEAPQSQHVMLPPGQDMTLEEWDKELPLNVRDPERHKKKLDRPRKRRETSEERERKIRKTMSPRPGGKVDRKRKTGVKNGPKYHELVGKNNEAFDEVDFKEGKSDTHINSESRGEGGDFYSSLESVKSTGGGVIQML